MGIFFVILFTSFQKKNEQIHFWVDNMMMMKKKNLQFLSTI